MVMLSELLQYKVTDAEGDSAKLTDLAIHQLDTDYPPVTHVIFRAVNEREERVLSWKKVKGIDSAARQIKVKDLGQATDLDSLKQVVRLQLDVLDALILDLQNRKATRANDLWLEQESGQLKLSAADTSGRAILRRLVKGQFDEQQRASLYDWKYIEFLRGDPQAVETGAPYHRRIVHLPPGEIAHLTAHIPYLHAAELLTLLPKQLAADTMEVMSPERQLQVFEELEESFALEVLQHMAPDLATDIIVHLDIKVAQHYLNRLPKLYGQRIVDLLKYPADTVGGIMTNDVVTLSPQLKVEKARSLLRETLKKPDFVYFVYVVEDEPPHKLRGVVSLRQFLTAKDDQTVEELMNPYLLTLSPFDSPKEAGYRLLSSQLAALPVVGTEGQLLGTVTIDAAVSQVAPRSWRAQAPKVFS
ncbi:MAG TPA: CBS domain-containing protein [Anaerolineales bacterium]|jgi:CBS domain-containing protein|nr:CBS domain-containing protein [Anaerolineales bacterium]